MIHFPDDGELYLAKKDQQSQTVIFFCHFFKGHKKVLRRHIELVNTLGFDAYAFNLKDDLKDHQYMPYSPISKKFGLKHAIADQIGEHLDLLTDYKSKVVFAFSNVASCAIEALSRRENSDLKALICDSGPGKDLIYSSFQLIEHEFKVKPFILKSLLTPVVIANWSIGLNKDIPEHLKKLPKNLPILSIRGWKDPMIKPEQIDQLFNSVPGLNWQKLSLPAAGHLNGLRDFEADYKPAVENFLKSLQL